MNDLLFFMDIMTTKDGALIQLNAADIESAVRHFICECHPEFARGHVVNPAPGQVFLINPLQFEAVRKP